jgi:hypothetical protein
LFFPLLVCLTLSMLWRRSLLKTLALPVWIIWIFKSSVK